MEPFTVLPDFLAALERELRAAASAAPARAPTRAPAPRDRRSPLPRRRCSADRVDRSR